jgi:hypothetical protein
MVIANELKTRRNKVTIYEKEKQIGTQIELENPDFIE